jgi:hypothetical protein
MATCGENCRLCHESLPPKHRTIFTETLKLFVQLIFSPFEQVIVQPFSLVDNDVMQMGWTS